MEIGRIPRRVRARRAGGALAAALLLTAIPPSSDASTASKLDAAKARLGRLEQQIAGERVSIARSQARMARLAVESRRIRARYSVTVQTLMQTRDELAFAQQQNDDVQARLNERAVAAYMAGPGSGMEMILGATSPADLADRLMFLDQMTQADVGLADQAERLSDALRAKTERLQTVQVEQARIVGRLNSKQTAMTVEVAQQQSQLEEMARSRTEIEVLIEELTRHLSTAEMASAGRSLVGTDIAPYGEWAGMLLESIGAPTCMSNLIAVVAWETAEGTAASWNPLAIR